jgi:hypothetical protein
MSYHLYQQMLEANGSEERRNVLIGALVMAVAGYAVSRLNEYSVLRAFRKELASDFAFAPDDEE